MILSGLYVITNNEVGKFYVGSSVDIKQRFRAHRSGLNNNRHSNQYLQRAWNKYGQDAFTFQLLYTGSAETCRQDEQEILDLIFSEYRDSIYNLARTADSPLRHSRTGMNRGCKHSADARKKKSEMMQGQKRALGYRFTDEQKQRKSDAAKRSWEDPLKRQRIIDGRNKQRLNRDT